MSQFKATLATLLFACWLPATSWSYLEHAGWIPDTDDGTPVGESSQTAPCWNVGPTIYKVIHSQREPAPIPLSMCVPLSNHFKLTSLQNLVCRVEFGVSPPEFCKSWQFSFRAASAPRAPSFAS